MASKYVISNAHCMFSDKTFDKPYKYSELLVKKKTSEENIFFINMQITLQYGKMSKEFLKVSVKNYTNHEKFNKETYDYDITIIELAKEVNLTTYTPACIAMTSDTKSFDNKNGLVYGKILIIDHFEC